MNTHNTYTIAAWQTLDGRTLGWKLQRCESSETTYDDPQCYRSPRGIELADGSLLKTRHGSLDWTAVFEPADPDDTDPDYRIAIGYYTGLPYLWAYEFRRENGEWSEFEEHSFFTQSDYDIEEILGPQGFDLCDATIARRILEFMHELM